MTTPAGVYPFATQDGKAIPLDVIKPTGVIPKSFTSSADSLLTIPADAVVGTFTTTKACIVKFGSVISSLADGVEILNAILVPADSTVTVALTPGPAYIRGLSESGTVYLQLIEKWVGLALNTQYSRK